MTGNSLSSLGTEEEGDEERDAEKMERREKRRDSEGQPPHIPEKVIIENV